MMPLRPRSGRSDGLYKCSSISDAERSDLLQVLEDRQETRSTIIASQLDATHWHDDLARRINSAHARRW